MSRAGARFSEVKELLMKDEEFRREYEKHITQEELPAGKS